MIAEQRETQIRAEEKALRINLVIDFITFIPVTLVAILSNSVLLLTDIFDNIKSLLVTFISWKITKRLIKGNFGSYNYGLGKVEVLAALGSSIIIMIGIALVFIYIIQRMLNPEQLDYNFIYLGIIFHSIGLILNSWLWIKNKKLSEVEDAPLMNSQWRSNFVDALSNVGILLSLIMNIIFRDHSWSVYIDPISSFIFIIYPILSYVNLIKGYINDLIDKTLSEDVQIKILKSLTKYFDEYEAFIDVKSRKSGRSSIIDIILGFHPDKRMGEIKDFCKRLINEIEEEIPNSVVSIIIDNGSKNRLPKSEINDYQILPISTTTLDEALSLIKETFALSDEELPREELEESISPGKHFEKLSSIGISDPAYWVVYHKGHVIGLTGLYYKAADRHEAVWGGWTVYDSKSRTSISRVKFAMLKKLLAEVRSSGRKYFRLYTSTDPVEAQANHLYDRLGFKIYHTEKTKDGEHTLLYRQAIVSEVNF